MKRNKRIDVQIRMPSVAFMQFLRKVVSDEEAWALFRENPRAVLRNHGVELDASVGPEALMTLAFAIERAREIVADKRFRGAAFESIFAVVPHEPLDTLTPTKTTQVSALAAATGTGTGSGTGTSATILSSAQASAFKIAYQNRGSYTDFQQQQAIENIRTNHTRTLDWGVRGGALEATTWLGSAPLLDSLTLGRLLGELDLALRALEEK